ncbi:E3 SUMO-protein ligase NSE2 isoform X1 [Talpa occidentalis]|uniref:E3 SUMO-protein ligase NSE2 isoform X1 n=2 Tax=Talpa occidentalis TaxID=50954 RepID=UPI0023F68E3B|nr:E3 SUMO-protein ligase NSE2 isoform X1 [Talpa occidentalis]
MALEDPDRSHGFNHRTSDILGQIILHCGCYLVNYVLSCASWQKQDKVCTLHLHPFSLLLSLGFLQNPRRTFPSPLCKGNNFKMPGRSSSNSGSTGFISFSGVESALSSLRNFQSCINSGMDTASSVALDLVETQTEVSSEYSMDKAMIEFAMMDRELNHYVKAVQSAINHVKEERPEKIPDLKLLVEKKFLALQNKNSDADFQNNEKFVQFKQQLKDLKKQYGLQADREADGIEGVDEDMIVTQSQTNFICPITQLEMKKPVKNKVCGHTYEEEAIVRMIESKHRRKKKACCPKIGCSHTDVRMSDLILDEALRRAIESHKKKRQAE